MRLKAILIAIMGLALIATSPAIAQVASPTGVTVTGMSDTTLRIKWTDNSTNEDGFNIYRANNQGSAFIKVGEVAANTTQFDDTTLTHPMTRHYRVVAFKKSVYIQEDLSDISLGASGSTISAAPPNAQPVANDDTASGVAPVTLSGNVLANDTDSDTGQTLTVQLPNSSGIEVNGNWTKTFNTQGVFTFPYTVIDGVGGSDSGVLTVTIAAPPPVNQNPVAIDDSFTVQRDQILVGNVITQGTDDSDPDSDPISVDPITTGPFILSSDGSFSFTPPAVGANYVVDYTLRDNRGGSDIGRVTIDITEPPPPPNNPPVAVDDSNTGQEDVAIAGNVLLNDTDADNDILSVQQPNTNIAVDGSYSITNANPGTFNYSYTVLDGQGGSDTGNLQLTVNAAPPPSNLIAFPGAEGHGRFAVGGRGGAVMFVTNTNDSGAGSLRACVEASGPRTCVFRKSGYITLATSLDIVNPFITIAGETAPGQGITLRNGTNLRQPIRIWSHDVIIRHLRSRPGGPHHSVGSNGDGMIVAGNNQLSETENITDIILDHVSLSWATDENIDFSPFSDRLTLQNSLIYEGLKSHSKGPNLRGCGSSLIGNAIASNTIRNPNHTCGKEIPGSTRVGGSRHGEVEIRNNVIYNGNTGFLDFWNGRGEGWGNYAGNVFKRGLDTPGGNTAPYGIDVYDFASSPGSPADNACPGGAGCTNWKPAGTSDPQHICIMKNADIGDTSATRTAPIHNVLDPRDSHIVESTDCVNDPAVDPDEPRGLTGTVTDAAANPTSALNGVVEDVGAFPNNRDAADSAIVNHIKNGTGRIPTCVQSGNNCGGLPYPTLAAGTNYPDADSDGMDDTWEPNVGGTSATANGDHDSDGYTNLEEFLHFMAAIR